MSDIESRLEQLGKSVRHWQVATATVAVLAVAALLVGLFRQPTPPPAPALPAAVSGLATSAPATLYRLKVQWLEVVDEKGNTVISMNEGAGGGIVHVTSAAPKDHSVMVTASPHGAKVQVSSQAKPRQFGLLKIMDGKPYLQMYEEGEKPKHFYQAPLYAADGSIGGPAAAE